MVWSAQFELNIGGEDDDGKVDLSAFDELKGEPEDEESEQTSGGEEPDFEDDPTTDAAGEASCVGR